MKKEFNQGWTFQKENNWVKVTLPHDAMLAEARTAEAKGANACGFFPGGSYTYQKEFELSKEEVEKHLSMEFEGVYKNARIFVNGREVRFVAYGYISFLISLDEFIQPGKNVVRVETDNLQQPDSRWYSGAGIYRPVWLHVQNKKYIQINGIEITTTAYDPAQIQICTKHSGGEVTVEIRDDKNEIVAFGSGDHIDLEIQNAKLWSENHPDMYTANVTLMDGEKVLECVEERFGIRGISWNKDGLFINGEKTLLRGGCIHHDNGILGACEYDESAERKIRILKESGFNAIRSAHNPCSKAILRACDKYGMYIMDETWDMWYKKKSAYDYANDFMKYYEDDIRAIVEKDFNHPSVIMYSIGNEVSEPAEEKGVALAKEMVELFHELDSTRAVTGGFNLMIIANAAKGKSMYKEDGGLDESESKDMSGMNSTMFNMMTSMVGSSMNKAANGRRADLAVSPVLDVLDIAGYNYASGRYKEDQMLHSERLIFGSETFPQDLSKNWSMVEEQSNLIGDFMWTAWDYLGEAGLGAWSYYSDAKGFFKPYPWLLADTGVFDILGNPNGEALWAKTIWEKCVEPEIAVGPCNQPKKTLIKAAWRGTNAIPSWSWMDCEMNKAVVEVYSSAPYIELLINGKHVKKKKTKSMRAIFDVRYMSGEVEARAYDCSGKLLSSKKMKSAEKELRIGLKCEKQKVTPGEIIYMDVTIEDHNGVVESNCDEKINMKVTNGTLLGYGSANPRTEEGYLSDSCTTYYGHALAVIRAEKTETIVVEVSSIKLPGAKTEIICSNEFEKG